MPTTSVAAPIKYALIDINSGMFVNYVTDLRSEPRPGHQIHLPGEKWIVTEVRANNRLMVIKPHYYHRARIVGN